MTGIILEEQLKEAIRNIHGTITELELSDTELEEDVVSIPADPDVKNFSFIVVNEEVYYRENSVMNRMELPAMTAERVKGMVKIRDVTNELIQCQMEEGSDEQITKLQGKLNEEYDTFTAKYGLLSSNANKRAFGQDSSYCLLTSLEFLDDKGELKRKADIFTKRTIRRAETVTSVDERFNSIRPREYDGSHIQFVGMNPEITLMPHQKNAVAHVLYGNNTLLAHCVGAGKTFQMIAAGMESKRLGLSQKNLYVVPNHLTEQWGSDFLRLYPGANILVATKKDFEPANRKRFCSRIATGDYDAVIIGHTQFEKIPLSRERQIAMLEDQIADIAFSIEEAAHQAGQNYTIKQLEKTKKSLQTRMKKLNDQTRKDDVVTFEQLGVDRLFVDESHSFKNLFLYTRKNGQARQRSC